MNMTKLDMNTNVEELIKSIRDFIDDTMGSDDFITSPIMYDKDKIQYKPSFAMITPHETEVGLAMRYMVTIDDLEYGRSTHNLGYVDVDYDTVEREMVEVDWEETELDFTSEEPYKINGENYLFVVDYPSTDCGGECHNVIRIRPSDGKYFKHTWSYDNDDYYTENDMEEVFPERIVTTKYK